MSSGQLIFREMGRVGDSIGGSDIDPGFNTLEDGSDLGRSQSNANDGNEIFNQARQSLAEVTSTNNGLQPSSPRSLTGGRVGDFSGVSDGDPGFNMLEDANDLGRRVRAREQSNATDWKEIIYRAIQSLVELSSAEKCLHPSSPRSLTGTSSDITTNNAVQAPLSPHGVIVDRSQPFTSIQIRLIDGTRVISQFNNSHTIRDVRAFVDTFTNDGLTSYRLQTMDFPPKQLTDLEQTIEESGIGYSVLIQRL